MSRDEPLSNLGFLKLSWHIAGGVRGVFGHADFGVAVFVAVIAAPAWILGQWWDQVLTVLPTVLGFTLSGFAIFLGFGEPGFKRFVAKHRNPDKSLYMSVGAAFVVFISCQLLALLYALVAKAMFFPTPGFLVPYVGIISILASFFGFLGYLIFVFSLILSLRVALRIYRLSRWHNLYINRIDSAEQQKKGKVKRNREIIRKGRGGESSAIRKFRDQS